MPETDYSVSNRQIENRNYSYPTKYKFSIVRAPKAVFFANSANIPGLDLSIGQQPTGLGRDIPLPGNKLKMESFDIRFLVDEDLSNYAEINKWIRGLGFPESLHQIYELQQDNNKYTSINSQMNIFSDGTLQVLNSNEKPTIQVKYYDLFPFALTSLVFDATISKPDPIVATVKFHYTYFDLLDKNGNPL